MKTVLITETGRGLGKAIAKSYRRAGFLVIATDVNTKLLADLPDGEGCLTYKLDVTSEDEVALFSELIQKEIHQLDVLISNAGIFDFYPVSESGSGKLKKIFNVNVFGLTNLTRYFLPLLSKANGRLIVISSESYKVPSPFQPYSVSKQALESVYKAIKIELSVKGIKSVLIRPGAMDTKIIKDTIHFKKPKNASLFEKEFAGFLETVPKYIGNVVHPENVAEIALTAGTSKKPKSIYHVNHNPLVTLLSILPAGLKDRIIRRSLK